MNFLSCEYFVAIYRAGSIRKAAGELFITQQALSGQLNKLEGSWAFSSCCVPPRWS